MTTLSFYKVMFSAQEVLDLIEETFDDGRSVEDFINYFTELAEKRSRENQS